MALVIAIGAPAGAQSLTELSLEKLMRLDAGRVFGASERSQPVTEAPTSVSFITAEDIARYGYRTLADILHGVRGMYVSDDRNFSLLGARGFGKPGDYNSRILLLVNGHRVNDNIFGQAEIGAEFGLDPATFERVEIIRGPASSVYGDSAFFAVVNVITKTGASIDGSVGDLRDRLARHAAGARHGRAAACATAWTSRCRAPWSGPTASTVCTSPRSTRRRPTTASPKGSTASRFGQHYGRLAFGNFTLTGAYGRRRKDVPTASFGTLFNEQIERERTIDRHTLFDRRVHAARSVSRAWRCAAPTTGSRRTATTPSMRRRSARVAVGYNDVAGSWCDRRRPCDAAAAVADADRWAPSTSTTSSRTRRPGYVGDGVPLVVDRYVLVADARSTCRTRSSSGGTSS